MFWNSNLDKVQNARLIVNIFCRESKVIVAILLIAFDSIQAFSDDKASIMKTWKKPIENNGSGCDFASVLSSLGL